MEEGNPPCNVDIWRVRRRHGRCWQAWWDGDSLRGPPSVPFLRTNSLPRVEQGTVKWFNEAKGYNFISPNIGGMSSCILPYSRLGLLSLQEGQALQFDATKGPKGWQAENVQAV